MHIIANRPDFEGGKGLERLRKDFDAARKDYLKANDAKLVGVRWYKYIFQRAWLEIKAWRHARKVTKAEHDGHLYRL